MRKTRKRWKEGPQFQNYYGGFNRDLILIFGLNLRIGFTVLSRGTHSDEFLVVKMLHMRCNTWEKFTHKKIISAQSFCTGPDDPAEQCPKFRSKSGWSGPGPDDLDLVTCERPEQPRSDDPALYQMIRTWEFQCVFSSFCSHLGWFEGTPDDPDTTRKHTTVTFGGGSIYTHSPPSFTPLSLPPTNHASLAFNPSLLSILELDSCKETPWDWEEVRFEVWFESTPWASTCSSQEAFEATSIRRFAFFTLGALLLDG